MGSAPTSVLGSLASLACVLTLAVHLEGPASGRGVPQSSILPDTVRHLVLHVGEARRVVLSPRCRVTDGTRLSDFDEEGGSLSMKGTAMPGARRRPQGESGFGLETGLRSSADGVPAPATGAVAQLRLVYDGPLRL